MDGAAERESRFTARLGLIQRCGAARVGTGAFARPSRAQLGSCLGHSNSVFAIGLVSNMTRCSRAILGMVLFAAAALSPRAAAETGAEAWLRYAALDPAAAKNYAGLPGQTLLLGDSPVLSSAQQELVRGVGQMLGRTLRSGAGSPTDRSVPMPRPVVIRNSHPRA